MHVNRYCVDLAAYRHNLGLIRRLIGPRPMIMAVVKANAYGHGAARIAREALAMPGGASWLGVATLPEALALRDDGIAAPVLVMGHTAPRFAREAALRDVTLCLHDPTLIDDYARAGREAGVTLRAHAKIDTGMGRLGVPPAQAAALLDAAESARGLALEGVYTHFSCSDSDPDYTRMQIAAFEHATRRRALLRHASNSGGVFGYPQAHFDMVRPGVSQYGLSPFAPEPGPAAIGELRPILTITTELASVKTLSDGASVGYNRRYRCDGERRIAVIPIGYGDGFRRTPKNFGEVLVRGQRAPILGTVCMDQTMIDVTDIEGAAPGDAVVVIGEQGGHRISADDVAARLGTINYEVTTALLARPGRDYDNASADAP
jgi:Alr-MurF fusion protein